MWEVHVPKRVAKIIARLPAQDGKRIMETMRELQLNPWNGDIVKIKGEDHQWRRRLGNYRIFYSVAKDRRIIEILEIERRASNTY